MLFISSLSEMEWQQGLFTAGLWHSAD